MKVRILLLANSSFKLVNFRANLITALLDEGHELTAAAPRDDYSQDLLKIGVAYTELPMNATGTSVFAEAALFLRIFRIILHERPNAILGYTIKPNIYGALSARILDIPFLPNVTGLGSVFDNDSFLARFVKSLYRVAFRRCPRVFLQNPEDLMIFLDNRLVSKEQAHLLPGSGVDLKSFPASSLPGRETHRTFLLVARMLREKGVVEFVEAARTVSQAFPEARFILLGPLGTGKNGGLEAADMERLTADGIVEHCGNMRDVRPVVAEADCVVLPSYYREGTPRSLLEAAAMGRPIITTDMPGCKDVVEHGISGFLCKPRDVRSLEMAMLRFMELGEEAVYKMGKAARIRMEERFDERTVINAYFEALKLKTGQ